MWVVDLIILFLELNISFIFMFYLFLFCPVVASRPDEEDPCWFLQNMICHFYIFKTIYI